MDNYNGYSNRSTWLAMVHLGNTSAGIDTEATRLAKKYADNKMMNVPEAQIKHLLKQTRIDTEEGYSWKAVNLAEVLESYAE